MRLILTALPLALIPAHAMAQQCASAPLSALPKVSRPSTEPVKPVSKYPINTYSFVMSWTPAYCGSLKGPIKDAGDKLQCEQDKPPFGFAVHGLWGETDGASWPQWCATKAPAPTLPQLQKHLCIMPSATTQMHEWKKHGACGPWTSGGAYWQSVAKLNAMLKKPDLYKLAKDGRMVSAAVVHEFTRLNPMLQGHEDAIQVQTMPAPGKPGTFWLKQVHLCLEPKGIEKGSFVPKACAAPSSSDLFIIPTSRKPI
jgi:ribonuclease T2